MFKFLNKRLSKRDFEEMMWEADEVIESIDPADVHRDEIDSISLLLPFMC
jgi:hypothetical protein